MMRKPEISIRLNGYDGTGQAEKRDDAAPNKYLRRSA